MSGSASGSAPVTVVSCVAVRIRAHAQRQAELALMRADQRKRVATVLPISILDGMMVSSSTPHRGRSDRLVHSEVLKHG